MRICFRGRSRRWRKSEPAFLLFCFFTFLLFYYLQIGACCLANRSLIGKSERLLFALFATFWQSWFWPFFLESSFY